MDILIGIGIFALVVGAIVFLIWVSKCISQKNSILELYDGYFTGAGAYFYLIFSLMRFVAPVLIIGEPVVSAIISDSEVNVGTLLIMAVVGIGVGLVLHLLKRSRDRQLQEKYGPVAAKELSQVMIRAGWGVACSFGMKIVKESAFLAANPRFVQTTTGELAYVVHCGNGIYIDRHGNTYTAAEVQ